MGQWLDATKKWLSRGKIWDDVFTRTLSIIISGTLGAIYFAVIGVIEISARGWLSIYIGGVVVVAFGLTNIPWFKRRWERAVERGDVAFISFGIAASITYSAIVLILGLVVLDIEALRAR